MEKSTGIAVVTKINDNGSVKFRLTERKVDRHGEVVESSGMGLDNFKKNPIVLFGHGYSQQGMMPIGKIDIETIEQTDKYIDADVIFDEDSGDAFAIMVADKVRNGFLNAGSIGFSVVEISTDPVLPKQTGRTHTKSELLEFSIVPIPALASATARREFDELMLCAKSAGYNVDGYDEVFKAIEPDAEDRERYIKALEDIESFHAKAGAVLSKKNKTIIKSAIQGMKSGMEALEILLEANEDTEPVKSIEVDMDILNKICDDVTSLNNLINPEA
jgi:hypothetical protein